MTEPTISDLNAAYAELEHLGDPIVSSFSRCVHVSTNIRIWPGFTGQVKGSGATLSAAIFDAFAKLQVVRATVPPIPRDMPATKERAND
jgi:hypothetical protein